MRSITDNTLDGRNVLEFPWGAWEAPPGLAVCPLDVLFMLCQALHSWLNCNDSHISVSVDALQYISISIEILCGKNDVFLEVVTK